MGTIRFLHPRIVVWIECDNVCKIEYLPHGKCLVDFINNDDEKG